MNSEALPRTFVWRRVHSITGLWLVVFIIQHLLINSQAALLIGDDGSGFVKAANSIHDLPYLPLIEIGLLGLPILIHTIWGIQRLRMAKYNSFGKGDGSQPYLPHYTRNRAFTWQRVTSWILVIGIVAHVVQMRFVEYPTSSQLDNVKHYFIRVGLDEGLYTLAERLGVQLYNKQKIEETKQLLNEAIPDNLSQPEKELMHQKLLQQRSWLSALEKKPPREGEVIAMTSSFGVAELLMVRDTFKMPIMILLYTLFVMAACFHGFNGLWTFCITWGLTLSPRSQRLMLKVSTALMILVGFLGLAAVWMTYWINLKY